MSQRFVILLGLLFFPWTSPALPGDTFEAQHEQALAANLPDVHLKISLDSAQTAFRIGGTIRLKYEFTADTPGKYLAGARFLDHGQRSVLESSFTDRPADARDPLQEYWDFHRAIDGNISAPREPTLKLGSSPQFDSIELTHYLRFSRPGRYRVYVVTRSVLPPGAPVKDQGGPPVASENIVTIRILPQDLAAASREVDEIVARAHQQPSPRFTPVEAFRLFEIATPKARKAAASLYTRRNNYGWSDEIALATILAAPTHAEAITLLRARLSDSALVADENLIQELSLLQFLLRNPKLTPSAVRSSDRTALAAWHSQFASQIVVNWQVVAATIGRRPADIRASTLHSLDHLSTFYFGSELLPVPPVDRDRIRSLHLAALPDLPYQELANDLLNFRWTKTLPPDQVLAILTQIYAGPPAQNASFIRETALKEIAKLDPQKAQALFREHVLDFDTPLDWNRIRSMNLPPSADLDAELIRILEDRWSERMSRVAPIVGLYATDSILPRVKKVYEVYGPDWPCSIEAGLLTYFLRHDPAYGTEKLGPALSAYDNKGGSDCHQTSLLVDLALLRNGPELQPFVSAALNDPRPLVAAAGARVTAFGDQAKIPLQPLLTRLRALHDEWADFDTRSSTDPEYLKKWNSGYNELERTLSIDFVNAGDSPENAVIWKQALDLCITDLCRNNLRQRLARSKF
ncbi:MAG: hypothetical protein ACHQT6_04805 [Candidatus Acidiferrales bacterium]